MQLGVRDAARRKRWRCSHRAGEADQTRLWRTQSSPVIWNNQGGKAIEEKGQMLFAEVGKGLGQKAE